jgi:hypothetical protein
MSIPITPQDTQKNCAPVSSNCVIWQGPDIPFLNLCKGDSISDVTAKLAAEVSTLITELNIDNLDLSCFPPICPKPLTFNDVIQFILNTLCAGGTGTNPTPGNFDCNDVKACMLPIAECFRYTDTFGNLVTEMSIEDYATAIASRVCTMTQSITNINITLTDHEARLDVLEACVLPCSPPPVPTVATSCLNPSSTNIPVTTFASTTETALCNLQAGTGTPSEITTSLSKICIADNDTPLSESYPFMANIPGWTTEANMSTLAESLSNLWLAFCDLRNAHKQLEITVSSCCGLTCNDVIFSMTGEKDDVKFIYITPVGNIPTGFTYCTGTTGATITVTDAFGDTEIVTTTEDIISDTNSSTVIDVDTSSFSVASQYSIVFITNVSACLSANDGATTCNINEQITVVNQYMCTAIASVLRATGTSGQLEIEFTNWVLGTNYNIFLYNASTGVIVNSTVLTNPATGTLTHTFTGLTDGTSYYAVIQIQQGIYSLNCTTGTAIPTSSLP